MLDGKDPSPFATLIGRTTTPMLLADDERRYVEVNDAACRLTGHTREELLEMRVDDLVSAGAVDELWQAFLREGEQAGRISLATKGGERVDVAYSATAHVVPGRHLSVLVPASLADEELDRRDPGVARTEPHEPAPLTPREREVLTLLALGRTGPQIAEELTLSSETVRNYTRNARDKLGARTRAHAIAIAVKLGQVDV